MSLCTIIDEFSLLWWGILSHRACLSFLFSCKTFCQILLNNVVFLLLCPLYNLIKKITQSTFLPPLVFLVFCSPASPSSFCVSNVSVTFDLHPVTSMTESTWGPKNKVFVLHSSEFQLDISIRHKKILRPLWIQRRLEFVHYPWSSWLLPPLH